MTKATYRRNSLRRLTPSEKWFHNDRGEWQKGAGMGARARWQGTSSTLKHKADQANRKWQEDLNLKSSHSDILSQIGMYYLDLHKLCKKLGTKKTTSDISHSSLHRFWSISICFKTQALFLNSWQFNKTRREFQGFYIIIKTLINADSTSSRPIIMAIILS